jgi:O-antigen ligase
MRAGVPGVSAVGGAAVGVGLVLGVVAAVQPALALVGAVGAGLGLGAVRWPALVVAFMYLGMLFDRLGLTGVNVGDFPVTASKLSVGAGLGAWVLHAGLTSSRPLRWHPVLTALVGLIATTAVGIAVASTLALGKFTLYGLIMMLVMVALVYAILAEARLELLYRFMAVVLVAVLMAAIAQPNVTGADGRVSGPMGDPNEWATTVLLVTPLLLGGLAGDDGMAGRVLRLLLVVLAPLAVLRSESRAALVALVVVSPALLYLLRSRRAELAVCGGALVVVGPFFLDLDNALRRFWQLVGSVSGRGGTHDDSFEERSELFRQGVALFRDHWLLGAGPGTFETATGFVSHQGTLRPAHNTYLEIAAEQGVVGLVPAAIFGLTVVWTLYKAWKGATRSSDRDRLLGAAIGLGAFALMAATLGLLTFAMGYFVLGFSLALAWQGGRPDGR